MDAREKGEGYWETPEGEGRLSHAYSELAEIVDHLVREERTYRRVWRREAQRWGSTIERIVAPMMAERWYFGDCARDPELAAASFSLVRAALPPEHPETRARLEALDLLRRSLTCDREEGAQSVNQAKAASRPAAPGRVTAYAREYRRGAWTRGADLQ